MMDEPRLTGLSDWVASTTVTRVGFKASRDDGYILFIDEALKEYHAGAASPARKAELTLQIFFAADNWLKEHEHKKNSHRREAVTGIKECTLAAHLYWAYTARRDAHRSQGTLMPTKALDDKYALEAKWRFRNGDPNAIKLRGQTLRAEFLDQYIPNAAEMRPGELQAAIDRVVGTEVNPPSSWRLPGLAYFSKEQRLQYMLVFMPSGGTVKAFRRNYRTQKLEPYSNDYLPKEPWVCDEYGNFYSYHFGGVGGTFQHSSLLHGRPVVCAGMIDASDGQITYIDNESGHYRPTKDGLKRAVTCLLNEHQVNIRKMTVRCIPPGWTRGSNTDQTYPDGHTFLKS